MKSLTVVAFSLILVLAKKIGLQEFNSDANLFSAEIYKQVLKNEKTNFLVSPFSIQTILALSQSGAKDETATEIRKGLRLPKTTEKIENAFKILLSSLNENQCYHLHTANKIYVKNEYPLNENFKKIVDGIYQAEVENINFERKSEAVRVINSWVQNKTENKIRELIDEKNLSENTRLILVNALYFKGTWEKEFLDSNTKKADFYRTNKDVIKTDTMYQTDWFNYQENKKLGAKFLEMLYSGGNASMIIVLPNEKQGLDELETQIEKVLMTTQFKEEYVRVALPKFTTETKIELNEILQDLGIEKAFTKEADFSGIAGKKGELSINQVVQKTYINVNEKGTEAAAATAVEDIAGSSADIPPKPKIFTADHPFMFYIKIKNFVIFEGRITSPV